MEFFSNIPMSKFSFLKKDQNTKRKTFVNFVKFKMSLKIEVEKVWT